MLILSFFPIEKIYPYLPFADLVLIMSVRPGFGSQSYMDGSTDRIASVRSELDRIGSEKLIPKLSLLFGHVFAELPCQGNQITIAFSIHSRQPLRHPARGGSPDATSPCTGEVFTGSSLASNLELQIPNFEFRTPNSELRILNSKFRTPNSEFRILRSLSDTGPSAPGTRCDR